MAGQDQDDALALLQQMLGSGGGGLNLRPPAYPWALDERENFRPSYRGDEPPSAPTVDLREFIRSPLTQSARLGREERFSAPTVGAPVSAGGSQNDLQGALAQLLGGAPDLSGGYSMGRRFGQASEPLNLSAGFNLPGLGLSIGSSLRPGRGLTAPEFRAYHRIPF